MAPAALLVLVVLAAATAACGTRGTSEVADTSAPAPSSTSAPLPTFPEGGTPGAAAPGNATAPGADVVPGAPTDPEVRSPGASGAADGAAGRTRLGIGPCPVFPADHAFNTPVAGLPVHPRSERVVAAIGRERELRYGFSSTVWEGTRRGYPVNLVDATNSTPTDFMVAAVYLYFSNGADVPLPDAPRFEGWPGRAWDKHLVIVDATTCRTRELLNVQPPGENLTALPYNMWYADAVVSYDLRSNAYPIGGANAAGVSMLAGLVRYDEVAAGRIDHALAVTMSEVGSGEPVWPAHRTDGRSAIPDAPPMGSWFRLRADVDTSTLGPQARVVAEALREYGAVLVDTGPGITITGEPDVRWNDADLAGLASIGAEDLELVDVSSLVADTSTHRARRRG